MTPTGAAALAALVDLPAPWARVRGSRRAALAEHPPLFDTVERPESTFTALPSTERAHHRSGGVTQV